MTTIHKLSHSHRRRILAPPEDTWHDNNGLISGCWAAYQPKGAASLAASYTDLTGQGRDAAVGVAPTWDAVNGWIFNGSTQYLVTTFVPQNDQSQTIIAQFTNVTNNGCLLGAYTASGRSLHLFPNYSSKVLYSNGDWVQLAPPLPSGNLAIAGSDGYRNGVDETNIGAWSGASSYPAYIGARNKAGVLEFELAAYVQAVAIYDVTLSAADVATIAAAMAAL